MLPLQRLLPLTLCAIIFQLCFASDQPKSAPAEHMARILASVPLAFEPNVGQAAAATKFLVHRPAMSVNFAPDSISLILPAKNSRARLGISFDHAASIIGERELPGKTNYLHGKDPGSWHTGIANFARIRYSQLWPGVDLVFYGNGDHMEHDFIVAAGADPARIAFELRGANSIETAPDGDLLVHLGDALITLKQPIAYQEAASGRKQIAASFQLNGSRVSFRLGSYDHRRPLIIDPVLVFSTLLAGSTFDSLVGIALDAAGNIYVTGETDSTDFPTLSPEQASCSSCSSANADAFITKLNSTGTALVYSTFLGGNNQDTAHSIAVDTNGNAIISGITLSSDFPAVNQIGTFTCCDIWNLFVASLSASGTTLNYSGVIGPLNSLSFSPTNLIPSSTFSPLAVDSAGNAYLITQTIYPAFPTTPSALAPVPANPPAAMLMALKIGPTGSLIYSTAIPGRATPGPPGTGASPGPNTFFQTAIAVDSAGSAYIAGQATDGLPATLGVIGPAFASDNAFVNFPAEGFLLKVNPTGSALSYATYIPGTWKATALRLDGANNAYIGGISSSPSLPVSATGFQKDPGCTGCQAGFLLKLNAQATAALAGSYLRGAPRQILDSVELAHIALDSNGNVIATGDDSKAINFPMKNPLIQLQGGFIYEFSNDLSTLLFASGGPDALIEVAPSGKIILGSNNGFPATPGAFQTSPPAARGDLFSLPNISAIDLTVAAPAVCVSPSSLNFGSGVIVPGTTSAAQSATLTNCGNSDLHISSIASNSINYSVSTNCALAPAGITAGSSCTVTATYSPVDYNSGSAVITDDALLTPHSIGLFGFPKAPHTGFSPGSLTFLETPITTSLSLPIQIFNNGITNLTISGLSTTGDFSVSQNCAGAVLAPPTPSPAGPLFQICTPTVTFSPANTGLRNGTLVINDTSLDSPHTIQLSGQGLAAWPTPALAAGSSVNVSGTGGGAGGSAGNAETLVLTGGGFSRVTTAIVDGIHFDNNSRVIRVVGPQELDLSLEDNDFGDVGEVPVQVLSPAPGGGVSNGLATIISPAKFTNLIFRQIQLVPSGSMVVGPKSGLIYDGVGNTFLTVPNQNTASVAVIDPTISHLVRGLVSFPHAATVLAISDDEQFLYAAFPDNNTVAQISLPSGTINFMASLGSDPALGAYNATSIRVMPGHPHTWVAALQPAFDTKPIAIKIFDDATPRANTVEHGNASSIFPGKLLFVGGDISTVYSIDSTSLYRFTIDANGIALKDKTNGLGAADIDTDGKLLYLSTGAIIDPSTLVTTGSFALAPGLPVHAVAVDGTTSRAIFAGDAIAPFNNTNLIQAFDTTTLAAKGSFTTPGLGEITSVLRWGTNGLAFNVFSGPVTLTRSSLTGNSGLVAPFHIGAASGQAPIATGQVSSGQNTTFALSIIGNNGFNGPITLSCSNLPQAASCSFSKNPALPGDQVVVTISTHQAATAGAAPAHSLVHSTTSFVALAGLLSLPFALTLSKQRHRRKLLGFCLLIAIIGCGGGGSGGPTPTPTPTASGTNTPIGTYDIILTGSSSSGSRNVTLQLIVLE